MHSSTTMGVAAACLMDNVDFDDLQANGLTRAEREEGLEIADKLLRVAVDQAMLPHDLSDIDDRLQVLRNELARCEAILADEDTGRGLAAERKIRARVERYQLQSQTLRFLRLRLALMRTYIGEASRCEAAMQIVNDWFPSFAFAMMERQAAAPLDCSDLYSEQQLREELTEIRRVMREVVGLLVLRGIRKQSAVSIQTKPTPLPPSPQLTHWFRPATPPKALTPAWRKQRRRNKSRKQRRKGVQVTMLIITQ